MILRFSDFFRVCTTEEEQSAAIENFGALDDVSRQYMLGCLLVDVQASLAASGQRHEDLFTLLLTELERVLKPSADDAPEASEASAPSTLPAPPKASATPEASAPPEASATSKASTRVDKRRKPPTPTNERPHPEPTEGGAHAD